MYVDFGKCASVLHGARPLVEILVAGFTGVHAPVVNFHFLEIEIAAKVARAQFLVGDGGRRRASGRAGWADGLSFSHVESLITIHHFQGSCMYAYTCTCF